MPAAPPVEIAAIATALTLLAISIFFVRLVRTTGPSRVRRILVPALFFSLGTLLILALPIAAALQVSGPGVVRAGGLGLALLILLALVSAGLADAIAGTLGAERTPRWLAAGIGSAILITYGWILALAGGNFFPVNPVALTPALLAAAAAITWWPYLPRPEGQEEDDEEAAAVFE